MAGPCTTSRTLYNLYQDSSKAQTSYIIFHDGLKQSKLSYEELDASVKVVSKLLDDVSPNEVIACLCRPHVLQPILMLSILKSSSAFTFLDLNSPIMFLDNLEKFVNVTDILAEEKTLESLKFPLCSCWEIIKCVDILGTSVKVLHFSQNHCNSSKHAEKIRKTSETYHSGMAYVIQTSGTTGEPKVVQVPHQCIVPNIVDLRSIYGVTSKDVILLCAPLTFDPSIVEIFLALNSSASLVIVPDYVKSMPEKLAEVISVCAVTIMQATPSLFHNCGTKLLCSDILTKNTSLRVLCLGGERCPSLSKMASWKSEGNKTQFYNIYGITEVSCWATVEKIDTQQKLCNVEIPLGKPLLDTDIEIRNENDEVIGEGYGQLFIGGSKRWCVLNDEPWPLHSCRIMRPTGDWVYKAQDGSIYFEGRKDSIIKYHGRKIFMCSLNKVIESKPEVHSHSMYFNQALGKLYVFLALNESPHKWECEAEDKIKYSVLQALRRAEPNCPPVVVIIVPFIPITAHGKVDNKCLMCMCAGDNLNKSNVPNGEVSPDNLEKCIKVLWQDYTKNNFVKDGDNFIMNGGDSVSSVQFTLEMEQKFDVSLPGLLEIVLNSTFKNVCKYVQECLHATSVDYGKCKRFKANDGLPSSTIPTDHEHRVASPAKMQDSLLATFQNLGSKCYRMLTRRDRKQRCFCGKCFSSENEPQQVLDKYELFLQSEFKFNLEKCIDASPCCCDFIGSRLIAFIGSHSGYFVAVDIEKGSAVWEQKLPDRIESSACLSSCGNFVLVGCYDHFLYCFNAWSGEIIWTYKTKGIVKCSPTVSDKNIAYCGSYDHHLYALSLDNAGSLVWKTKISNGSIFSSPAISVDNSSVYVAALDGVMASLNPDTGDILWKYCYTSPLFSSPLAVKSNVFIGSVDGSMLCFNENGELVRKYLAAGPIFCSPSFLKSPEESHEGNKNCIVFGSHGCVVYCYSVEGAIQWEFLCSSAVYATPFSFSKNGQCYIVVACTKGTVYILSAHDGSLLYSVDCSGEIFSSPVVINDYLVIGCRDNNLFCFKIK